MSSNHNFTCDFPKFNCILNKPNPEKNLSNHRGSKIEVLIWKEFEPVVYNLARMPRGMS